MRRTTRLRGAGRPVIGLRGVQALLELPLQLVAVIHVGTSALLLRLWPSANLANAHYDKLYSLALLKHERVHGSSAKGDDVIGMLEEETEALIQKRYVPHHREDDD